MTKTGILLVPMAAMASLSACGDDGKSTREMEQAAMERTREELGLQSDAPLEATVWVGKEYEGNVLLCGTVSSMRGSTSPIAPQRFAASTEPVRFHVFEEAHSPMVRSEPDKFISWEAYCAGQQPA